jgi:hypothetical protein
MLGSPKLEVPLAPATAANILPNITANVMTTTAMMAAKIAAQNHPDRRGAADG